MLWAGLVLFYGIVKGFRDVVKKKALTKNTVMEVLFVYTVLAFLFCIPEAPAAFNGLPPKYYFLIAIKSFVIFIAWICSFKALDNIPISIYGVLDLSRILFSTAFGLLVLHEKGSIYSTIGLVLVLFGLVFLRVYPEIKKRSKDAEAYKAEKIPSKYIWMVLASCILNAVSGCLDKIYMKEINSSQLQFWYMFYLVSFYGLYFVIRRIKISASVWKNGWIWLLSFLFFIADKALFIANSYADSKVIIMTLLKQSACIISIVCGKFIFKEKNIGYKLFCAAVVLSGLVVSMLGG
ncbi:MAG: EamA family transporter [Lachnospiraceae bacterium]|nr:EamA family transporter [Lachnospiraceae bacterium]